MILEVVNFVVIVNSNIILQIKFLKEIESENISDQHQFELDAIIRLAKRQGAYMIVCIRCSNINKMVAVQMEI